MCQTMPLPDAVSDPGLCHLRPPGRARNGACPEHRRRDPEIGRFLTRDPLPGIVGSPASQNPYAYVLNNPANYVDPTGLCGLGLPCPGPVQDAGNALASGGKAVGGAVADLGVEAAGAGVYAANATADAVKEVASSKIGQAAICAAIAGGIPCFAWFYGDRFLTWECAGFALDLTGYVSLRVGGPLGVPVAAAAFAGSLAIDFKEGDYFGGALGTGAEVTTPLGFAQYAPGLRAFATRVGGSALIYSGSSCLGKALF